MPTQIMAVADTAANSSDFVVVANTPRTVCLKDAAGPTVNAGIAVDIHLKDDAGLYFYVGRLTTEEPMKCLTAPGTYRFVRRLGQSVGIFEA